MLKKLRHKKTAKKVWIVLAVLILPAFLLWGSGSIIQSSHKAKSAGTISGRNITLRELEDSLSAVRNQAIIQFGDNFAEVQKALNLEGQAWERLILLNEAKRRQFKVTDKEVIDYIQNYPFFQGKKGFDNYLYNQMLKFVFRTQPRVFEEETRQNLMISKLYKEVTGDIKVDDKEIKEEYRKLNESLSIDYIAALPSEFAKDIAVTEAELKEYFTKNSFQFKLPLSFNIEYVEITSNETDMKTAEEKAKTMLTALKKDPDLEKIAKNNNLVLKETGTFPETGPIPGIGWSPQALGIIAKAKAKQILKPMQIDKSLYLMRVKERKEPYVPKLEDIKSRVKDALIKEKSSQLAKEKIALCSKDIGKGDFTKLAKEFGLKSGTSEPFKYGGYIEGIGASDKFWSTADELKDGQASGIIDTGSGFYIIKVNSRVPIDEGKFEKEKKEFADKVLMQKKQESFAKFSEQLKDKSRKNYVAP